MGTLEAYRRVLGNPALRRLLAGEFVSSIGDWLYLVAILVVVYQQTQSPVLLGIVGAARILPYILLSVPAGIVADRVDRRKLLLATDLARGSIMVVLAVLVSVGAPVAAIIGLAVLATCFSAFFGPAIAAFLPTLVADESELAPANTAWSMLDNLSFIIGPAVAGLLIAAGGLTLAFVLNAISFGVIAIVLARLPAPPGRQRAEAATPGTQSAGAEGGGEGAPDAAAAPAHPGWGRLLAPLAAPVVIDVTTSFFGGGLGVLTVVLATEVLGAGEEGTGYLNAAIGVGGILGSLVAGVLVLRRLTLPLLVGGVATGIGTIWLGIARDFWPAILALTLAALGSLVTEVIATTLIQRGVPDAYRGRVVGVVSTIGTMVFAAGSLFMPILVGFVGIAPVFVLSGVAILVATVFALVLAGRTLAQAPLSEDAQHLMRNALFAGLTPARLETAARRLQPVTVSPGEVVIRQGDPADRFYVIVDGSFLVTQARGEGESERQLREMGQGEVFGEIGLLTGAPRTATVTATAPGRLLALDGPAFLELVGSGPGLGPRLLDLHRGGASLG